jgi:hypothetical protein
MTTKNEFAKPCTHCSPNLPPKRSIVEPILTLTRSEVLRVAGSRSKATPLCLSFRCRMCDRTWAHRVDVQFLGEMHR